MKILIGLDPGGNHNFGWCIAADSETLPLPILATGCANDAHSAVTAAIAAIPEKGRPVAAGIDAPLFWSRSGTRNADSLVRAAYANSGALHSSGTVQNINSLRGACLVQGLLAAIMLREFYPGLPTTEAHPKVLRRLLPVDVDGLAATSHERDAILSAIAAWGLFRGLAGWSDLYPLEPQPYSPVSAPLHYFMPGMATG